MTFFSIELDEVCTALTTKIKNPICMMKFTKFILVPRPIVPNTN